jgi:hypothetical protein
MARKLDRTRHYDQSYGETNLRFYQDKRWFNNLGEEVDLNGRVIPDPVAASPVPATAPPPPPVSLPTPGTDPADEDAGPGVSVEQALGNTIDPAAAPPITSAPSNEGAGGATAAAEPEVESEAVTLERMNLEQLRKLAKRANAPQELLDAKGTEARKPIIDWLLDNGT